MYTVGSPFLSEFSSAPHRTAPYRTVPHRTAPYRTVPHRTAPYRTVPSIVLKIAQHLNEFSVKNAI